MDSETVNIIKGLFEEYDYTHFTLNPQFAAKEFDEDFADYDF